MDQFTLLEKMQTQLLVNDQKLTEIDEKRSELAKSCQEEQSKISTLCAEIQAKVEAAGEVLKEKTGKEFSKFDDKLLNEREDVRKNSLVLCPELELITKLVDKGEFTKSDVAVFWERVKDVLSLPKSEESDYSKMPIVYPSKTLSKIKSQDIGFVCLAEYLPHKFHLALASSHKSNVMFTSNNRKVVCTVTTDERFTEMVQANIKFSIKNKMDKEAVPYCKEECKLSEDKKSFQICFKVQKRGVYVVTVLLYDQHVNESPLTLVVNEVTEEVTNTNRESTATVINQQERASIDEPADQNCNKLRLPMKTATRSPTPRSNNATASSLVGGGSEVTEAHKSSFMSLPSSLNGASHGPRMTALNKPKYRMTPPLPTQDNHLPPGPLDLSHLAPGTNARLTGLKVLGIENGSKPECLQRPIGMCLLPNGNIVVASTFEDKVKMYKPSGQLLSVVQCPEPPFLRPSDMVTLQSGQFVVRDNTRVQVFSPAGNHMRTLWQDRDKGLEKCYGLAQDKEGRLVTVLESKRPKRTDLLLFDLNTGEVVKKVEMEDIIKDKSKSMCRFLTYYQEKLYITDLGLDCVYVLDQANNVKVFGSSGAGPGQFSDPAGLVVDHVGNMIVADSKNHRLCVFNTEGHFVCNVSLVPEIRRPSGVVVDRDNKELYVLTLQGRLAMTKYKL